MENCQYHLPQAPCSAILEFFNPGYGNKTLPGDVSMDCGSFRLGDELPEPVQFSPNERKSLPMLSKNTIIEKKCMYSEKDNNQPPWCVLTFYDKAALG